MIPKISDFGMSRKMDSDASVYQTSNANPEQLLGPILWSAPETLDNIYNQATDVWSYGCVLVEMMTGKAPYASQTFSNVLELALRIRGQGLTPLLDLDWMAQNYGVNAPQWLRELATLCFQANPDRRPTFQHICAFLEKSNPTFFTRYQIELDNAELARQNLNATAALSASSSSSMDSDAQQDTASRLEMEAEKIDISALKLLSELGRCEIFGQRRSRIFSPASSVQRRCDLSTSLGLN
jgi:serine/threonine protein kinase